MEMEALCVCLLVCVVTMALIWVGGLMRRGDGAPPGPPGLPLIGHLHLLSKLPHQSLLSLSNKYGPLMSLRLGSVPVVVASSPDMARLILQTHDHAFAGRPLSDAASHLSLSGTDIAFSQPNASWRLLRRLCATELFSSKRLHSLVRMREEEVRALLLTFLPTENDEGGDPVVLRPKLMAAANHTISRMVLGKRLSSDDHVEQESLIALLQEAIALLGVLNVGDYIPSLAWMDLQGCRRRSKATSAKLQSAMHAIIDGRRHEKVRSHEHDDPAGCDFLDVLLQEAASSSQVTDSLLACVVMDIFTGGTGTSSITIEWTLAELLRNPKKLKRLQEEIDGVVGRSQRVQECDITKLPYLQAVVKESMRLHPALPLLMPHLAIKECNVAGLHVPVGTQAYVNVWAIGRDPNWWECPLDFYPERFLDSNVDMQGMHFQLLPFGSGKRMCPSWRLSILNVQYTVASLIHGFDWITFTKPDMSEVVDLMLVMATPLCALAKPRLPPHCYIS